MSWLARFANRWVADWLGRLIAGGTIVEASATLTGSSSFTASGTTAPPGPVVEASCEMPGTGILEAVAEAIAAVVAPGGRWGVSTPSWPTRAPGRLILAGATLSGYGHLTAVGQARPGKAKQARQLLATLTAWRRTGA